MKTKLQFSQNSLQDYIDCPRRFQLRYIQKIAWPALESQPVLEQERLMRQGARFHELIYQHQSRLPVDCLEQTIIDPELETWWQSYLNCARLDLPACRYPEFNLQTELAGHRLVARFDLLAVEPLQRMMIVDWKTARKRPLRAVLENRLQTRLYPFMVVEAGACLNNRRPVLPGMVEMVYWFPLHPDRPERFCYTPEQYQLDRSVLVGLIQEITSLGDRPFEMAREEKSCRFCVYRSLCERGTCAGDLADRENEPEGEADLTNFDFFSSAEVSF